MFRLFGIGFVVLASAEFVPVHAQFSRPTRSELQLAAKELPAFEPRDAAKFRELETVSQTPLFPSLPFIKLRAGDSVVRAQTFRPASMANAKVPTEARWSEAEFYLKRDGKYLRLPVGASAKGELVFYDIDFLPLFDVENLRENAEKLADRKIAQLGIKISPQQLLKIQKALLKDFAEHIPFWISKHTESENNFEGDDPRFNGIQVTGVAVNHSHDTIFYYQVELNSSVSYSTKNIIEGPKSVTLLTGGSGPNASGNSLSGESLKLAQAKNARAQLFSYLIYEVLEDRPRKKSLGFGGG